MTSVAHEIPHQNISTAPTLIVQRNKVELIVRDVGKHALGQTSTTCTSHATLLTEVWCYAGSISEGHLEPHHISMEAGVGPYSVAQLTP